MSDLPGSPVTGDGAPQGESQGAPFGPALFRSLPSMLLLTTRVAEGVVVTDCTTQFLEVTGFRRDDVVGYPLARFVTEKDVEPDRDAPDSSLHPASTGREGSLRRRDSSTLPVRIECSRFGNTEAEQETECIALTDLTTLRKRERALRHSEKELEKVVARAAAVRRTLRVYADAVDTAPDLVQSVDATGRFTYVNRTWCERMGYTKTECSAMSHLDVIHPEERPLYETYFGQLVRGERDAFVIETTFVTRDGTHLPIEARVGSVADEHGALSIRSVNRDISNRKRLSEAQRLLETRYRMLAGHLPRMAVLLFDKELRYLLAEGEALLEAGYVKEAVEGRTLWEVAPPDAVDGLEPLYRCALRGEWLDTEYRGSNGTAYRLRGIPVLDDGVITGGMLVIQDISDQKEVESNLRALLESAQLATRAKSEFLANMSHELRTPLNAIVGMTGLLLDTSLTAEQEEYAATIRLSSNTLLALINDVLDFSKIEAGHMELEEQQFNLRQCVEEALDLVATWASEKGLDLAYLIDPETPEQVVGDVTRLRQILVNLLSNAVKFTERGEIAVTVTSEPIGPPEMREYRVRLTVRDTGIGIAPSDLKRLFEAFRQVDASTTRRYGGTGLGLVISQRLAHLMGGGLFVESEPGVGSTFSVTMRLSATVEQPQSVARQGASNLKGARLLIVDDNGTNRQFLSQQLRTWGIGVSQATSAADTLTLLNSTRDFDMAILDLKMPQMDGRTLASTLRQLGVTFPLVLLSSAGVSNRLDDRRLFAATLSKPVKPVQLHRVLVQVLYEGGSGTAALPSLRQSVFNEKLGERYPLRVLLAEDNVVNQRVALRILERMGYHADAVATGQEAVAAVVRQPYDLVLMDIQMPVMGGLEAAREIRALGEHVQQPWIVALTAHVSREAQAEYSEQGMEASLSKPLDIEALEEILVNCWTKRVSSGEHLPSRNVVKPEPPALATLDEPVLRSLQEALGPGGTEAVEEIIEIFLSDTSAKVAALEAAGLRGEWDRVYKYAHNMKGSSASLGGSEFSALCARLEAQRDDPDPAAAGQLLDAVVEESLRLQNALRAFLASLQRGRR